MADLSSQLNHASIPFQELDVLLHTDRGDVLSFVTPHGAGILELWQRLRAMAATTRYWPVVVGDVAELKSVPERAKYGGSVSETLQRAQAINVPQWFLEAEEQRRRDFMEDDPDLDPEESFPEVGEWPDHAEPTAKFHTLKRGRKTIAFALVPTQYPWEVPAFMYWGGWNSCPYPEVHCALQRYWDHVHGAVITVAAGDVLEMWVDRPPQTREAALALAKEQYIYCSDIVEQGTSTLTNLGAALINGRTWFFWWD